MPRREALRHFTGFGRHLSTRSPTMQVATPIEQLSTCVSPSLQGEDEHWQTPELLAQQTGPVHDLLG